MLFEVQQALSITLISGRGGNRKAKWPMGQPAFNYEAHKDVEVGADLMDGP